MSWTDFLDVGANLATGGLFGLGQTIYKASGAATKAGDEMGHIAAEVDDALQKLFASINAAAFEMSETARKVREEFALARPDGRSESEMSAEEVHRLHALYTVRDSLSSEIAVWTKKIDDVEKDVTIAKDVKAMIELAFKIPLIPLQAKYNYVNKLIGQILYEEPGDIPRTASHIENIVERFNTIEQQTIEDIIKRFNTFEQPRIEGIMDGMTDNLGQTQGLVEDIRRLLWIQVATAKKEFTDTEQADLADQIKIAQMYETLRIQNLHARAGYKDQVLKTGTTHELPAPEGGLSETHELQPETGLMNVPQAGVGDIKPLADYSGMTLLRDQNWLSAQTTFYQREQQKAEFAVQGIRFSKSLQPGVVTQTIDATRKSIERFNEAEQPRIEQLLGSLDQAVQETQRTLHEAQVSITSARSSLGVFQNLVTNKWVKIGAIAFVGLIGLILLFSAIALGRVAFHI